MRPNNNSLSCCRVQVALIETPVGLSTVSSEKFKGIIFCSPCRVFLKSGASCSMFRQSLRLTQIPRCREDGDPCRSREKPAQSNSARGCSILLSAPHFDSIGLLLGCPTLACCWRRRFWRRGKHWHGCMRARGGEQRQHYDYSNCGAPCLSKLQKLSAQKFHFAPPWC